MSSYKTENDGTGAVPGTSGPHPAGVCLNLSLLGDVTLTVRGRMIRIKSLKLRAMLGYIALTDTLSETRERLVGLLWSESGEMQARAVLRQVIRELRGLLADVNYSGLYIDARGIRLDKSSVEVDVWNILRAIDDRQVHPLLLRRQLLTDDLLAGMDDVDPVFHMWLMAKRHTLSDQFMRGLERAMADDSVDAGIRNQMAQAIMNLDPTHENACRRLMRGRAESGDTAGALRAYKDLWDLLDSDYGMEPALATQQLVAEIKNGLLEPPPLAATHHEDAAKMEASDHANPSAGGPATMVGTHLFVAVLPVTASSIESEKQHLVIEFRQLLIASLIRFRELRVMDASNAMLDDERKREIGGYYELRLIAHQDAAVVRLEIMLMDSVAGVYVWSDTFALNLESWFDSQRRIISRIAMALNVHLSAERLRHYSKMPDISLGLYDLWLRCQTLVRTFNPRHWERLRGQFNGIIEAAPEFGPAYGGLADMFNIEHIVHPGIYRGRTHERKALDYARKAVQLDPIDTKSHRCLAWSHIMARHFDQAQMHIDVACELNRNDSWTVISGALMMAFCGQTERASGLSRSAVDLTLAPSRTHWAYQTDILFLAGDYEAAVVAADHAEGVLWGVPAWRAASLAHLGRLEEARADIDRFLTGVKANWYGSAAATDTEIARWLLHLYPIARRDDWERLRDGVQRAGLPTDLAEYQSW
jgi:DNA-binding SARP family transcriptional activator